MILRIIVILALATFISCNTNESNQITDSNSTQREGDTAKDYGELLNQKENAQQNKELDNLGNLISTIEFKVRAIKEDLQIFDDGIVPWISLEEPEKEIKRLIDPDKIVLPYNNVTLIIDYPLNNPATFELTGNGSGFSRRQLIKEISKRYHDIYKEEEVTATIKTVPIKERKDLINRNQTNGKYVIWGHDLSDLDLSSIEVLRNQDGKIYLNLGVES